MIKLNLKGQGTESGYKKPMNIKAIAKDLARRYATRPAFSDRESWLAGQITEVLGTVTKEQNDKIDRLLMVLASEREINRRLEARAVRGLAERAS